MAGRRSSCVNYLTERGGLCIDERRGRGDLDGLGDRSEFQQNLHFHCLINAHDNPGERLAAKPCISAVTECSPTRRTYIKFASFVASAWRKSCVAVCTTRHGRVGHYGARGILHHADDGSSRHLP